MPRIAQVMLAAFVVALIGSAAGPAASSDDFGAAVVYPLSQQAKTVATGDLNGDGRCDVAVAAWPSALFVLYQQPDGSLSATQLAAPQMPLGLAVGDLNGDTRLDVIVGGTDGAVFVYLQQGDGTFGSPGVYEGYGAVNSLAIADFTLWPDQAAEYY